MYQGIEVLPNLISTIESSQLQEGSNASAFNEKFFQPLRDVALDLGTNSSLPFAPIPISLSLSPLSFSPLSFSLSIVEGWRRKAAGLKRLFF